MQELQGGGMVLHLGISAGMEFGGICLKSQKAEQHSKKSHAVGPDMILHHKCWWPFCPTAACCEKKMRYSKQIISQFSLCWLLGLACEELPSVSMDFGLLKSCLASSLALWAGRLPNFTNLFLNLFSFFSCPYLDELCPPVLDDYKCQILDSLLPYHFCFLRFYLSFCTRTSNRHSVEATIRFWVLIIGYKIGPNLEIWWVSMLLLA